MISFSIEKDNTIAAIDISALTLTAVSYALVPVLAPAGVRAVKVDTDALMTTDVRTFNTLVNVDVTVAARPTTVLTRRTTGNDVTRSVGSAPTLLLAGRAPTIRRTYWNIHQIQLFLIYSSRTEARAAAICYKKTLTVNQLLSHV